MYHNEAKRWQWDGANWVSLTWLVNRLDVVEEGLEEEGQNHRY